MDKISDHAACKRLRMGQGLGERMHRADRHTGRVECGDPFVASPRDQDRVHRGFQRFAIFHPRGVGREARVGAPFAMAEYIGDALPVRLIRATDIDKAVARGKRLIRR